MSALRCLRSAVPSTWTACISFKRVREVTHTLLVMQITSPLQSTKLVRSQRAYSGIACTSPGLNHLLFCAYSNA